jgi:putative nucleotidyltransferase with HDIG domain
MTNKIKQVENYVKNIIGSEIAHDFQHIHRVRNWALIIAKEEGFKDLEVVEISALMHDIGLSQSGNRNMHGKVGAEMASKFLVENDLLSQDKIDEICNAIRYHNKNREGEGGLLKILRDADMIDLFGAVGIMRGFISKSSNLEYDPDNVKGETWGMTAVDFDKRFDGDVGIGTFITDQINFQISCYNNLSTVTAKKIAKPFVKFMVNFMNELSEEVDNKRCYI